MSTNPARLIGAATITIMVLLMGPGGTPQASAGGPTSVLVSSGNGVAAVGYNDDRYQALWDLMEGHAAPSGDPSPPVSTITEGSGRYLLTWLIHDRVVWRLDFITLVGGEMWIETKTATSTATAESARSVFHRATQTGALSAVLERLPYAGNRQGTVVLPNPATSPPPTQSPESDATASIAFLCVGVLIGVAAGVLTKRTAKRISLPRRRPRIQLTDVNPPGRPGDP